MQYFNDPEQMEESNAYLDLLLELMDERDVKDSCLRKVSSDLSSWEYKVQLLQNQMHDFYRQFARKETDWNKEKESLINEKDDLEGRLSETLVKVEELQNLLNDFTTEKSSNDTDSPENKFLEVRRQNIVLKVNEKALARRHLSISHLNSNLVYFPLINL